MSLLSPTDQQQLQASFAALARPVTLVFFSQAIECETCDETRQILREITALTDKVVVEELSLVLEKDRAAAYAVDRVPSIVLLRGEEREDSRIRFLGAPEGWDFLSLVDAILVAGGASPEGLSDTTVTRVGQMTEDLALQVFVTPT